MLLQQGITKPDPLACRFKTGGGDGVYDVLFLDRAVNRSAELKRRLREAIDAEQYEEAARLRDEIKALEKEGE